jgi:hypothetical protein
MRDYNISFLSFLKIEHDHSWESCTSHLLCVLVKVRSISS